MQSPAVILNTNNQFSFNDGLQWLHDEVFIPYCPKEELKIGKILGNFFVIRKKDEGTEPGFMGVQIDLAFFEAVKEFFSDIHSRGLQFVDSAAFEIWLHDILKYSKKTLEEFAIKVYQDIVKDKKSSPLKLYQFKQFYSDPGITNWVGPDADQLRNSNTIQKLPEVAQSAVAMGYSWKRSDTIENCNFSAVCESIANAIASAFGSPTQTLFLARSVYKKGAEKLLLASEWENRLEVLTKFLAGSKKEIDYQNYLIKKCLDGKPLRNEKGQFIADTLNDLHANFILNVAFGDRDGVGSRGQNKGRVGNDFFSFDFGKCFGENPILATMDGYFQFEQPNSSLEQFKNYSIFSDASLNELLVGVFYLYKLAGEDFLRKEVLNENEIQQVNSILSIYEEQNPDFKNRVAKVFPGAIDVIFDRYIKTFRMFKNTKGFEKFEERLEEKRSIMNAAVKTIMHKFKPLLMVPPNVVQVLDGFRRLTLTTSETSEDSMVALNHLRVLPRQENKNIEWQLINNDEKTITYHAIADSSILLMAEKTIRDFFENKPEDYGMRIAFTEGSLKVVIKKSGLVIANFSEDKIKAFKQKVEPSIEELETNCRIKYEDAIAFQKNELKQKNMFCKEKFVFHVLSYLDNYIRFKAAWEESCNKKQQTSVGFLVRSLSAALGFSNPEIRKQDIERAENLKNELQSSITKLNNIDEELLIIGREAETIALQVKNASTDQSSFRQQMREISKAAYFLLSDDKRPKSMMFNTSFS